MYPYLENDPNLTLGFQVSSMYSHTHTTINVYEANAKTSQTRMKSAESLKICFYILDTWMHIGRYRLYILGDTTRHRPTPTLTLTPASHRHLYVLLCAWNGDFVCVCFSSFLMI